MAAPFILLSQSCPFPISLFMYFFYVFIRLSILLSFFSSVKYSHFNHFPALPTFFFVKLPRQTLLANYRCYRCYHLMCDVSIADLSTFEQCWTIVKVNYIDFGQREFCRVCLCSTFSKDNHKSFIRICTSV